MPARAVLSLPRFWGYLGHGPHREILSWGNLASQNPRTEPIRVIFPIAGTLQQVAIMGLACFGCGDVPVLTSMHLSDC